MLSNILPISTGGLNQLMTGVSDPLQTVESEIVKKATPLKKGKKATETSRQLIKEPQEV